MCEFAVCMCWCNFFKKSSCWKCMALYKVYLKRSSCHSIGTWNMPVSREAQQIRSWIQKMCCHFLKTDANPNKWPQHVPFCFSWWQTIFSLNCTGSILRNLKEYSRWFMFFGLETWKKVMQLNRHCYDYVLPLICAWWTYGITGFLYWFKQSSHLLRRAAYATCTQHSVFHTSPEITLLCLKEAFVVHTPNSMSSDGWTLPQNIGRPQQTRVTHRACKFNCISLKTGRKTILWTRKYCKIIPKFQL